MRDSDFVVLPAQPQGLTSSTLTALASTGTVSPSLSPGSSGESQVRTEAMR